MLCNNYADLRCFKEIVINYTLKASYTYKIVQHALYFLLNSNYLNFMLPAYFIYGICTRKRN